MENEKWRSVIGFDGLYEVSDLGNIRSSARLSVRTDIGPKTIDAKVLKPNKHRDGYLKVVLCVNKKRFNFLVHRLVAISWIENPGNLPQVNHKDGNKLNNAVSNLEWNTCKENIAHAIINNLRADVNGEKNARAILKECDILPILTEARRCPIKDNLKVIGLKYGVSWMTIYDILTGRKWSTITGIKYQKKEKYA